MNDEQKEWHKQYSKSFGTREFLRFGCALMLWLFVWTLLVVLLRAPLLGVAWPLSVLLYAPVATRWRPAYALLRMILGNKEMPPEPYPRGGPKPPRVPLPWWAFIPGIWLWLLTILLFYLAIRYFTK